MIKITRLLACTLVCVATLFVTSCSKGTVSSPSTSNEQIVTVTPSPASKAPSTRSPGGDAIDTSQLDSDVSTAENTVKEKPGDEDARVALAHAYLARANALTKARQYRSALGDYRRTLKYDPQNKEAVDMSGTIISILKQMGRDIPPEGQEPPPLPMGKNEAPENSKQKSY